MRQSRLPVLALALPGLAAAAAESPEELIPAIAEVRLNGQETGLTLVIHRDADGSLLLREADLAPLRITNAARCGIVIEDEPHCRFGAAPGESANFDDSAQVVHLELPASAFAETRAAVRPSHVPRVTAAEPGAFVNYDFSGERVGGVSSLGAIVETGVFGPRGVLTHSHLAQQAEAFSASARLDTTWTLDFPDRLETLRAGDSISTAGAWGRAVRFGGLQFGTNFATQPTLVTTPLLFAQGEAIVPSTVDIFVNGRRVASEAVPPGPFTIDHVPPVNGAGQLQVVVTDALGRQQVITQPYYSGPALLRAGLSAYSLEIGAIREDYGRRSNAYGDFVVAGTFRRGFTDEFTAEVHAEGQADGALAAGVNVAAQIGHAGIASATVAAGGEDSVGWLAGLGFERNSGRLSVFARAQFASEDFAQLGTAALRDRSKQRVFGGLGFSLQRYGNLQVSYGSETRWTGPDTQVFGLSHSVTVGRYGYLSFIASHASGTGSSTDLFLRWTLPFGGGRTASLGLERRSASASGDELVATASLQRSLPAGSGTGYYMSLASNEDAEFEVTHQGGAGRVGAQFARRLGTEGWRLNAAGGLAITSAGLMPSRPLDRSFAVVHLADYPDLTIYVENQPVGRTDRKGRVLLASLRPYEDNAVSIDPRELPLDASIGTPRMAVTPGYRSGPVIRFPIERAQAATLRLVRSDGTPVPAGAAVRTERESVPVALGGLVYLTTAGGRQGGEAEWRNGRCEFEFERPGNGDPMPDLGEIVCE
jgi:outer membrane usher protein